MATTATATIQAPVRGLATIREAEHYLNLSRQSVYNLMARGELSYVLIGRARRIPWAALEQLAQTGVRRAV